MAKIYRIGPIGALMDEYERAAKDLQKLLRSIDTETYTRILDSKTKDKDCKSIEKIMNHVVRSAYGYSNYIRKQFGEDFIERKMNYDVETPLKAIKELKNALKYTEENLSNKWKMPEHKIQSNIIQTPWGQQFDVDQLLEHAIVHILRHRRQIEKLMQNI